MCPRRRPSRCMPTLLQQTYVTFLPTKYIVTVVIVKGVTAIMVAANGV